ncbi:RDD family protein [Streptomyces sp. NPDC002889]|uniref:RDD family protein n=1 Tax=Streptomyces sp. NPDC002889 TaxID=3364669 RepID=UPI0036A04DA1
MSAPTPATGDGSPTPGYYPDPSIPGYVRYWNGAAWVPGTSRPAPSSGEAMPTAPGTSAPGAPGPSPLEETGPVFLDEDPVEESSRSTATPSEQPTRPEPASAWHADASRQAGFGGDRDHRVSWGGGSGAGQDPRLPAQQGQAAEAPDPRRPADPTGGALPGVRSVSPAASGVPRGEVPGGVRPLGPTGTGEPPTDGTVAIRAMRPGAAAGTGQADAATPAAEEASRRGAQPPTDGTVTIRAQRPGAGTGTPTGQGDGTMTIRPLTPGGPTAPAPQQPQPQTPEQQFPAQTGAPMTSGTGGGAASWAQQVHHSAQPAPASGGGEPPVVPWKPPVNDPFLQAAQAQAAARPASLGRRFAARLVDTLVLGALVGAVAVPVVAQARAHIDDKIEAAKLSGETVTVWLIDATTAGHLGIVLGALLVLGVLYEALPTAKWGRTLGKKLCGLSVLDIESHEPPPFGAALRRWLLYSVLGLLVVGVVNVLWCLFDRPWRQCWHDKVAHTFVTA